MRRVGEVDRFPVPHPLVVSVVLFLTLLGTGCGGGRSLSSADLDPEDAYRLEDPVVLSQVLEPLRRSAEMEPDEPYWVYRQGQLYALSGRDAESESLLVGTLAIDPLYAPAVSLLSKTYYEQRRHREGIDLLESTWTSYDSEGVKFPDELVAGLALHHEASGEMERADRLLYRFESPGEHWAALGPAMSFVRLRSEDFLSASPIAKGALIADPESAVNHNNYGITLLQSGDPVGARGAFEDALRLDPDLAGPLYNLAIVEMFYFFNETSAGEWFARYADLSAEDPDDLRAIFGAAGPDRTEALTEDP